MGQTIGRAPMPEKSSRFVNLPKRCVYELWTSYNDIAEGFGLTMEEFAEILKCSTLEYLSVTERILGPDIDTLFRLLDDDENKLVDSLEFIAALAMISGMTPEEKVRFVFAMFDFDESSILTLDEMVLAYRSCLSGASKVCSIDPPLESDIEATVSMCFDGIQKVNTSSTHANLEVFTGIDRESFVQFCLNTPDVMAWIEFFDDLVEYASRNAPQAYPKIPSILMNEIRTDEDEAFMNPTMGGVLQLELVEDNNKAAGHRAWRNVLPFLSNAQSAPPFSLKAPKNLDMTWVYGYNAHSSKQNLIYTAKSEVVYPAGAMVVVQNVSKHEQRHFIQHNDLVTALAGFHMEDGNTIVATGERGFRPCIFVWESNNCTLLSTLVGFHRGGVSRLDFSPNRELLVSLGNDPYHSMAIYNWRTTEKIWATRITEHRVHDIKFISDKIIACCGDYHVYFWTKDAKNNYKRYRGQGTTLKPENEIFWCIGSIGNLIYTGSEGGFLQVWEGRNWVRNIKAHIGPIYASTKMGTAGIVTGCGSGKVIVWNDSLEITATFNANTLGPLQLGVYSIAYDHLSSRILLGMSSCEIFEMDAADGRNVHSGGSLVAGHFHPRICGIAVHPFQANIICTVGDDKSIRIYDTELKRQMKMCVLDSKAHCCRFTSDGLAVLIGLGSGIENELEPKEGAHVLVNTDDLTILHEARDTKYCILDCKFSPDGEVYALSSSDGNIYLYRRKKMDAYAICRGHTGRAVHIDFSTTGTYIMSNSDEGELLFWEVKTGQLIPPKQIRTVKWETNSCLYSNATQSFPLHGFKPHGIQYRKVCKTSSEDCLFFVDNYGVLSLTSYPCFYDEGILPDITYYYGHSKGIMNCVVACDDHTLYTVGESDACIIQWKLNTVEPPLANNDLRKLENIPSTVQAELRFEGKALDRSVVAENVFTHNILSISEMEEGIKTTKDMQSWQKTIISPSRNLPEDHSEPPDHLQLEYVYGFTHDVSRQALHYCNTPRGEFAFFVANIGVVMAPSTRTQRYYRQHHSKITSMAANKIHNVVATGDQGRYPMIHIWDIESLQTRAILRGYHRKAVAHMRFCSAGVFLVTVGQDAFHSIAIYDWQRQTIVSSIPSFSQKCYAVDFNPNATQLIQCGHEIIRFWTFYGKNAHYVDATLVSRAKMQGFMCVGWVGANAVIGTMDGNLYRFLGHKVESIVQAHNGCVNAISSGPDGVVSVGADGLLKIWTRFLECRMIVETKSLRTVSPVLRAVDWDSNTGRILLGTAAAEIFEISAADGENRHKGAVLEGHGGEELWGLSVNPTKDEFCTVGDDCILRVWDTNSHIAIQTVQLEMPARCCAFSPDGKHIAVGFGSPNKVMERQFDGKWVVIDTIDYQISHEARDSMKWLRDIAYSPNGNYIAIGGEDTKIYVYNIAEGYNLSAVISQHQSYIISVDFSDDSAWIRANCGGFELCYFEAETGLYIPSAARLRDVTWSSQHCPMEWTVQGIWPMQYDATDYVAIDCNTFRGDHDGQIIVAGDNYGRLKMFRFPCTNSSSMHKTYWASSCPITRVRFASGDAMFITTSSSDKAIIQWKHLRDREESIAYQTGERRGANDEEDDEDVGHRMTLYQYNGNLEEEVEEELKQLVSTRPWIGAMAEPTSVAEVLMTPQYSAQPLPVELDLAFTYGLQTLLGRNQVFYNANSDIVVPTSHYISIFNKKNNAQVHYERHMLEVCAVAVSRDGKFAASVEKTARPKIHIWDAIGGTLVTELPYVHRKGVLHLEFNLDGTKLLSLGADDDHSIALWQSCTGLWHDGTIVSWQKGDLHPVLFTSFYEVGTRDFNFVFASGGRAHIKFWVSEGNSINPCYAEYNKQVKLGTILCGRMIPSNKKFIAGSLSGHLYVWKGRKLDRIIRAHERGITCIHATYNSWTKTSTGMGNAPTNQQNNTMIVTGSKEGSIKVWTSELEHVKTFNLSDADIPPLLTSIRSVDSLLNAQGILNVVLLSTSSGEIYEAYVMSGRINLLNESHYEGEVHGMITHPKNPDLFATVGDDCTIRVWSLSENRMLRKAVIDCTSRCISWSPDGKNIVVGLGGKADGSRQRKDGAFLILDGESLKPRYEGRDSRHYVTAVKYSPDGRTFAVASMDHKVYLYTAETFKLRGMCDKHNAAVKHLDFSLDNIYLQSDSTDYEHLYFEVADGQYFSVGSQLRDIKWSDWNCIYGWPVQGIWPALDEDGHPTGPEPTCCHRSPNQKLLAVGDAEGYVKIYNFPCLSKKATFLRYRAHVGPISRIRFNADNTRIISVGEKDRMVAVWKVQPTSATTATKLAALNNFIVKPSDRPQAVQNAALVVSKSSKK